MRRVQPLPSFFFFFAYRRNWWDVPPAFCMTSLKSWNFNSSIYIWKNPKTSQKTNHCPQSSPFWEGKVHCPESQSSPCIQTCKSDYIPTSGMFLFCIVLDWLAKISVRLQPEHYQNGYAKISPMFQSNLSVFLNGRRQWSRWRGDHIISLQSPP